MDIARELSFSDAVVQQVKQMTIKIRDIMKDIDPEEDLEEAQTLRKKGLTMIKGILSLLEKSVDKSKVNDHRYAAIVAELNIHIGEILSKAEKDDEDYGEGDRSINENCLEYLTRAGSYLTALEAHADTSMVAILINNELGKYYSLEKDFENALKHLKKAEDLYHRNSENIDNITLIDMRRLFDFPAYEFNDEEGTQGSEFSNSNLMKGSHAVTNKYYFILYHQMGLMLEALEYKFKELNANLELNAVKEENGINFTMQVANLSEIFLAEGCYEQVNYCLNVAEAQLQNLKESYWGYLNRREVADYGNKIYDIETEVMLKFLLHSARILKGASVVPTNERLERLKRLKFPIFEETEGNFEVVNIIPNEPVTNFNDAKELFLKIQKDSQDRKHRLDTVMNAYIQLQCDQWISQAYLWLSLFEAQTDRRAKIHKRRVDLFEKAKYDFTAGGDEIFKYLVCHDLGEAYFDLLNEKICQLLNGEKTLEEVKVKISRLRKMAIFNYKQALDFERKPLNGKFINCSRTSRILESCQNLASAYMKVVTDDASNFIECIKLAFTELKYFVDYCDSDPDIKKDMGQRYFNIKIRLENLKKKVVELDDDPDSFDIFEELRALYIEKVL